MEKTQSIQQLIKDIDAKSVVLPEFQRDFVWEISKTYDLFDSIVKNIFVGAIIYGIPSFEIAVRDIDDRPKVKKGKKRPSLKTITVTLEEINAKQKLNKGDFRLLLDGQQRTTALYRAIKGIDAVWFISQNESDLEQDFDKSNAEDLLHEFSGSEDPQRMSIKLSDVWQMDAADYDDDEVRKIFCDTAYYKNFASETDFDEKAEFKKFRYLKKKVAELFKQEKLLSYYLLDMSLAKFVVFFERSNTRGVQLNFIDILAAKLYPGKFYLKEKIQDFRRSFPNYDLTPETIVRAIAYIKSAAKEVDRNYILTELKADDFFEWWDKLTKYYKITLDFLYTNNFIISQDWMPYENMMVPLIIYVNELGGDYHKMTQPQKEFITFWYFNSILSARYSGATNERIVEDSNVLSNLAKGKKISSLAFFNRLTKIQILEKDDIYSFEKKGNAVYKGILNLINFHSKGLMDWNNDSKLSINSELEDHHIFPKAYLEQILSNEADKDLIDCVANRTLVPKELNIKISAQKPSDYLSKIQQDNSIIEKTLENHLIPKDILTGGYDNEYKFFLEMRAEEIFKMMNQHVVEPSSRIKDLFYEELKVEEASSVAVFGMYKNNKATATFNPSSKKMSYNGKVFDTPSSAATAAKIEFGASAENTENGWNFWKFIDDNGEEKRISELRKLDSIEEFE